MGYPYDYGRMESFYALLKKEEVEQAVKAGAEPLTLGKRILRTETAGLTMLSVLMFHLEG